MLLRSRWSSETQKVVVVRRPKPIPSPSSVPFRRCVYSSALLKRKELQLGHGEMLSVVGQERQLITERHRGNRYVRNRKSVPFLAPLPAKQASLLGNQRGDLKEVEGTEKAPRFLFLPNPEAGVDLGEIDGAATEHVAAFDQVVEEFCSVPAVVQMIDHDRGVKEDRGQ